MNVLPNNNGGSQSQLDGSLKSDSEDDLEKSPKDPTTSCSGQRIDTSESGHGTDEIVFISIIAFREKHGIEPGE